ncbi:MAG: hypothetical protein CFH10_01291, partial [Alphaproteobacteria bacterium MarineAlpha4_Bin2]
TTTTAETCDYPPTGNVVDYFKPPNGTKLVYEDIMLRAGAEQRRRELSYTVNGGTADEIDWVIGTVSGQDIAVRTFLGLMQIANSSGTASDFDRASYAKLWPLDTGKSIVLPITTFANSGQRYSSELSLCVRRFETLSLPAGKFETVVIDGYNRIVSGGNSLPFDEVYTRHWYAPQFGIYVQRVRAMYHRRREVMKQTRRAIQISQ